MAARAALGGVEREGGDWEAGGAAKGLAVGVGEGARAWEVVARVLAVGGWVEAARGWGVEVRGREVEGRGTAVGGWVEAARGWGGRWRGGGRRWGAGQWW